MIAIGTQKDSTVIDFFSGSATTAHAVMQLNAEDGGHRKFIMVQLPEVADEKSEARKAGFKTICDIGEKRIYLAGQKILSEPNVGVGGGSTHIQTSVFACSASILPIWKMFTIVRKTLSKVS
jgi:adenine-specific DNA-methyltransferase